MKKQQQPTKPSCFLAWQINTQEKACRRGACPMETDLLGVGFDFYWPPPHLLLLEDDFDNMYVPPASDGADSISGLYPYREDSNSPGGAKSCSVAVPTTSTSPPPQRPGEGGGTANKNMVMERDRRRRLNEKLYALRSVVPNITKMDKASIVRDAIAYIEKLQEEERRMLAEISVLESSSTTAVKTEDADSFRWRKRPRRAPDDDGATRAASAPPVQILEVQVSDAGKKMALVSVRSSRGRDAVAKVCRALEPLCLQVITATIAAVEDTVVHTMFVQTTEEMGGAQLKETVQAALAQLDVTGRLPEPIRFWGY